MSDVVWIRRGRSGYLHAFESNDRTETLCGIQKTNGPRDRWPRTWSWPEPNKCVKCAAAVEKV